MTADVGAYLYTPIGEDFEPAVYLLRTGDDPAAKVDEANRRFAKAGLPLRLDLEVLGTHPVVVPALLHTTGAEPVDGLPLTTILTDAGVHQPFGTGDPGLKYAVRLGGLTRGDFGHVPVSVQLAPPAATGTGRRPVVAILDTAVDPHPWLGAPGDRLGGPEFWVDARSLGWDPGPRLEKPPALTGVLGRELAEQEGHGTFTAGLVRQIAPDAQVLAVHVTEADGAVHPDLVLNALHWLLDEHLVGPGDVVCQPLGFRPADAGSGRFLSWLAEAVGRLGNAQVTVVAAAGNEGSDAPIYPAAFAASPGVPEPYRLRSVGALDRPGSATRAFYSNYGDWVTHWEAGVSLVSTFPQVNATATAEYTARGRTSPDSDDFTEGFCRWSGTSFATAIHAAKVTAGLA